MKYRKPLSIAAIFLFGLLLACVLSWTVGEQWLLKERKRVGEFWTDRLVSFETFGKRLRKTENSAPALELHRICQSLGVPLIYSENGTLDAPREEKLAFEALWKPCQEYLKTEIGSVTPDVAPPPPEVSSFMASHAERLGAVRRRLLGSKIVGWAFDPAQLIEGTVPNYLGMLRLQHLFLASALHNQTSRRASEASADLEASWSLLQSVLARPDLLAKIVGSAMGRYHAGVLRRIPVDPSIWLVRLESLNARQSFMEGYYCEAFGWHEVSARRDVSDIQNWLPLGRAWRFPPVRWYFQFSIVRWTESEGQILFHLLHLNRCDFDPAAFKAEYALPRWNVVGRIGMMPYYESWQRACQTDLDFDLTRQVLRIDLMRDKGAIPTPGLELKSCCSDVVWTLQRDGSGTLILSSSEDFGALDQKLRPWPLRHEVREAGRPSFTSSGGSALH